MRIGYPCLNQSIGCTSSNTFRLRNYSAKNLREKIIANLGCLEKILEFNLEHGVLFFRISSDLIPFASHPKCKLNWPKLFRDQFKKIGRYINSNGMRVSMHPDQFVLLNALNKNVLNNSLKELDYHAQIMDLIGLDKSHKIQIHVGGRYTDKKESIQRFIDRFKQLDEIIRRRLVVENDDRLYNLKDCFYIYEHTGLPIVLDIFHHKLNNLGEKTKEVCKEAFFTWKKKDGLPMVDYSSQGIAKRVGSHAQTLDLKDFKRFIEETKAFDFDLMLEIKDKEQSAVRAVRLLKKDKRLRRL